MRASVRRLTTTSGDDTIGLRPVQASDFDVLAEIRRDSAIQAMLLAVIDSPNDAAVRNWIDRRSNDPNGIFRVITDLPTQEARGYVQLTDIHHRNGYGFAGIAVERTSQGRGLGKISLHLLHRIAGRELALRKVLLKVRADNYRAMRLYRSLDYRPIGTMQRHFKDSEGALHDVHLLERMLDEV